MDGRLRTVVRHPGERPGVPAGVALALLAPLTVVAGLELLGNVLVTFALYHVLVCLVLPAALSLRRGLDIPAHLKWCGWREPSNEWGGPVGVATGVASGLALFGFVGLFGLRIFSPDAVTARLASWGLQPAATALLVPYMILVNSVSEELFWRGALHTRLETVASRRIAVGGLSAAFASYHVYTVWALFGDLLLAAVVGVAVFAGAVVWAGLREAFDSVKPAAWAHVGATAGYMMAYVVWIA